MNAKHFHTIFKSLVVIQSLSCVQLFSTPWTAAPQASLSFTISWSLLQLMSIESGMPSKHPILCCPLFHPPSIFPSIRVFSNESALCTRWPDYWSFSFNISPSSKYSGLIFLLSKRLSRVFPAPQFENINSLALSLLYGPTLISIHDYWKNHVTEVAQLCPTLCNPMDCRLPGSSIHGIFQARILEWVAISFSIALTIWTFVSKVMSLLFNMLSRFVMTFLLRSKCLTFMAAVTVCSEAVILEPKKRKSDTISTSSLSICQEVMGQDATI